MIFKNTIYQIIESILICGGMISIIMLKKSKLKLQIELGILKTYGKKIKFNSISLIHFGLGIVFIIIAGLSLDNINEFTFKFTVGIFWIISGFANKLRFYIKITNREIIKFNFDYIKISEIESILYTSDKIIIKTGKRTMDIFYADLNINEKQILIDDLEDIRLKNNLT
jgi:hypothetical protein